MTTALALFDLTDLTPDVAPLCGWCRTRPATVRVHAVLNLLGVHPTWLTPTRYRDATRLANSGPSCDRCAWNVATAWWDPHMSCPHGVCQLWVHTLDAPRPGWDCGRCHTERTVVWLAPLAVAE